MLPALALPNRENDQDTKVIVGDGSSELAAAYLPKIGGAKSLRLMVSQTQAPPSLPRLTWQECSGGVLVVYAAFVYGRDTAGRYTSSALLLDLNHLVAPIPTPIAAALDEQTVQQLVEFLSDNQDRICEAVREARRLGHSGGEIDLKKKVQ